MQKIALSKSHKAKIRLERKLEQLKNETNNDKAHKKEGLKKKQA
ncbi:MAG: hypothetical protein SGJ00_06080 [bacterium]|nr:hypothetical protein [bacterium]